MTREQKQAFTLRIARANSTQLVVILYEMTICYLKDAALALDQENIPGFEQGIRCGRECLNELLASLDCRYEVGRGLAGLYFYCLRELAQGRRRRRAEELERVRGILERLCEAYSHLADISEGKPLMERTQQVYAGMTYGRNALSHTVDNAGERKGILI